MAPLVTLITGCSSGIGLAAAVKLAQDPNKSYLVYATMRNLDKKGELEKEAGSALNDTLFILQLDITDEARNVAVVKQVKDKHGRIDVLVNNAAFGYFGLFEEMTMADMRSMLETNMIGTYRLTQEVIPIMKNQESGRILNISSAGGVNGFPFNALYCATKFAMEGLTETLYSELRCFNVWISTICPGAVTTRFINNLSSITAAGQPMAQPRDPNSKSAKLMQGFMGAVATSMQSTGQVATDIADVIAEVLAEKEPKVRYGTSDYSRGRMAEKYTDGVGGKTAEGMYQMLSKLSS